MMKCVTLFKQMCQTLTPTCQNIKTLGQKKKIIHVTFTIFSHRNQC